MGTNTSQLSLYLLTFYMKVLQKWKERSGLTDESWLMARQQHSPVRFWLNFCRKIASLLIYITQWQPHTNNSNLWLWFAYLWTLLTHQIHPLRLDELFLLIWSEFRPAYCANSRSAALWINWHHKDQNAISKQRFFGHSTAERMVWRAWEGLLENARVEM